MVWLQSYLTLQSQQVVVDGCSSSKSTVLSGIPQGLNLGPLLFFLYVNDIFQLHFSSTSSIILYADHLLLSCPFKSSYEFSLAQSNVNILSSWVKSKHPTIIITQKQNTWFFHSLSEVCYLTTIKVISYVIIVSQHCILSLGSLESNRNFNRNYSHSIRIILTV